MEIEAVRAYLGSKPGAVEDFPFGPETLVVKVRGKMFGLVGWDEMPLRLTLKCDPSQAEALRAQHPAVQPGYYMNKQHWNTVTLDGTVPTETLREMMDESYALVVKGLPKVERDAWRKETKMDETLTLAEIESRFEGEWILVKDPEVDDYLQVVRGEVVCHSKDRDEVYQKAVELRLKSSAFLYTGKVPDDMEFALTCAS